MIVACLAMVFCFTAGVSASTGTDDSVTVKIYLQIADRLDDPVLSGTLTESPIEVTAQEDESLYDVIQRAVAAEGNLLTGSAWHQVVHTVYDPETGLYEPAGEIFWALDSLTFDGVLYENSGEYIGTNTYTGTDWTWFKGTPAAMPALPVDYPRVYLSWATVADLASHDYTFTLSFESQTLTW